MHSIGQGQSGLFRDDESRVFARRLCMRTGLSTFRYNEISDCFIDALTANYV
jgi:hypothetical protein